MDTAGFFAKIRQQQQKQNPVPQRNQELPWWQDQTYTGKQAEQEPVVETEHDFSKATSLSQKNNCPNCNSSDFMKPSSSAAARCFSCGFTQGRELNNLDTINIMSSDAKTVKIKQTADGGAQKYRARISKNADEIRQANQELEQSLIGRSYIDS
jgi:hypothetical protein